MFQDSYNLAANGAIKKKQLLEQNPIGYIVLSILAGVYVGFGVLLVFTIGGLVAGSEFASLSKIIMGMGFSVALSLVVMAGAELFTGNNLVMTAGILKGTATLKDAFNIWLICWLGNAIGAVLLSLIYYLTGLGVGAVAETIAATAVLKMTATPVQLLSRGFLCNTLVCLAVWCSFQCKSESGKLIMIFWCIFAFFTTGFEHSVANMTLLSVALLNPAGQAITLGGWFYNLLFVTIGNMMGGIVFVALPYYIAQYN